MGNTVLGVVAPLPQGAWNSTTTYQKLSVVREGNSSYIAKSANVNIQPGVTDSWETYWMLLNEDGDTGQQGPQGATGVGVPDGGLKGYILVKRSQDNYDDEWVDPANITVGNATKALQDGNGNNIADTYQTKQDSTTQNTALQTQITSNTQGITQNSQLISRNSARLTNVEQRISPSPFVTDSAVAYVKDVPANALPYAELQKLGVMTRKCTNLLNLADYSGTVKGVSVSIKNEVVTLSGTATASGGRNDILAQVILPAGTYTLVHDASTISDLDICITETETYETLVSLNKYYLYKTFTITETINAHIGLNFISRETYNGSFRIWLNAGATALPYEPYFEGLRSAPVTSVESVGANLLPTPSNKEQVGVTVNVSADGIISFTGTSTDGFVYNFLDEVLPVGTYYISWNDNNVTDAAYLFTYNVTDKVYLLSGSGTFTTDGTKRIRVFVNLKTIGTTINGTVKPMLNKGATALPYAPYTKSTLAIPEAVQALDGYGEGNPDDPTEYNSIQWDKKGNCSYSHKGNIVNNEWVPLSNEIVTDISALITADNLIPVQGNGTITFVNEYGYAVPSTVEYMT